jgi:hypothetical protein
MGRVLLVGATGVGLNGAGSHAPKAAQRAERHALHDVFDDGDARAVHHHVLDAERRWLRRCAAHGGEPVDAFRSVCRPGGLRVLPGVVARIGACARGRAPRT